MKAIVELSALVALLLLSSINCEISSSSSSEFIEIAKMPEKQWADYKVSS